MYEENGIVYLVAFNRRTYEVIYISTSDTMFRTADGFKIGDSMTLDRSLIRVEKGWEVYGPITKDGWRPVFGRNNLKKPETQETVIGEITEEGDPTIGMPSSGKVTLPILYFSKSK